MKKLSILAVAALALVAASLAPSPTAGAQAEPEGIEIPLIDLEPVAEVGNATAMSTRAGTDDLYVAERDGLVRRLVPDGDVYDVSPTAVADVSAQTNPNGGERGLLGLAFSPTGNRLFLHFTNNAGNTRIVEFQMNGGGSGNQVVASSQRRVLALAQPESNHNGGTITYGPDNRLYVALGDGGGSGDQMNNAQNLRVLLGKILRINPNPGTQTNFSAPASNPFFDQPPRRKAIWLYGVRNPWRISFDMETGDLWVGDVGQNAIEEVDLLLADGDGLNAGRADNLGWRRMEGSQPYNGGTEPGNHTPPVFEYEHNAGRCSIIGGYVYRGANVEYDGTYFFGDFCTGELGYVQADGNGNLTSSAIGIGDDVPDFSLQSFGQDNDGEVYVLTADGTVSRIVEAL